MAKFSFQAKNLQGKVVGGTVEATSEQEVRVRLRAKQLIPLKILNSEAANPTFIDLFAQRVPEKEVQVFTRQFATMVGAGITVVDGIKILAGGMRPSPLKDTLNRVKASVEGGKRLADAMAEFPLVFDKFYINMVRAGEEAGVLENILIRLAQYMEKSRSLKMKVQGAMWYPAIVVCVTIIVVTFIMIFIIPKFESLYAGAGQQTPYLTQIVVGISHAMANNWLLAIVAVVGLPLGLLYYYRLPDGKDQVDKILIKSPLFGDLIRKSSVAKFSRTLSTLLHSGVDIIDAMDIASKTSGNKVIEDALTRAKNSISQGKSVAAPLLNEPAVPDMVVQMISVGEQSGTLDQMLGKIADFFEEETEVTVGALTSIIEPILLVFIGGIIAVLVVAMYLPIFNMADVLGGGAL